MPSRRWKYAAVGTAAFTMIVASAASADAHGRPAGTQARPDAYTVKSGRTTTLAVLGNDKGSPLQVVANTSTAHGTLTRGDNGTFSYRPDAGFHGTDSFTYTISDAVQLYSMHLPPLVTVDGVALTSAGFGSSLARVPGTTDEYYGLDDRGPNATPSDNANAIVLPDVGFDPTIAKFRLVNGVAKVIKEIPLRAADGTPYNGLVNTVAPTGEIAEDADGDVLPASPYGYDSEGLVALPDGTFWVSDEYGPFITHFDRNGRALRRLSPYDGTLPGELKLRVANKGMEGLTITPDGTTLVGLMQSALQEPDLGSTKGTKVAIARIVTYNLRTRAEHEYLYPLDNPATTGTANSEITALSDTTFLVDERDGGFPPGAYKKLYKISIAGATDVGPHAKVRGATYDPSLGLTIGGTSLEGLVGKDGTDAALAALRADHVTAVSKSLYLDLGALLDRLDPSGAFFSHDKVEGVTTLDHGRYVIVSNDSDFGLGGVEPGPAPYTFVPKIVPATGAQDDGQYLWIDTAKLPASTSTATVTIRVR